MDVLNDVLTATRIGGGVSGRLIARAPWGLHFDGGGANFHIIVRGECWLRLDGDAEPVLLREGDVTLLPDGASYCAADHPDRATVPFTGVLAAHDHPNIASVGGTGAETVIICGVYDFGADLTHPLLSALPRLVHLPAAHAPRGGPVDSATRLLAAELDHPGPGAQGVAARLVDVLLVYILRAWQEQHDPPTTGWFGALHDPQVGHALTLMHQAPEQRWTVARLATAVGLSRAAFARRFAMLAGEPPLTYLTRWRMITAAILLKESTEPLSAIANRVGYESEFAFARTFRRAHGQPPGRYRAQAHPRP
ncbi:AraC family transcriptional regulator [Planobispora takensis]|uniref:AraC family transcriptional regulator n=1 Tax=Planobispora takensis TaxID=1367882 RepID=A0A8J3WVT9_9ACTN|nr:AraC family transcriptional regulator [Planobispora takensis]GII04121.1 AraC family transcriptional regulator [Planobispora takensis]